MAHIHNIYDTDPHFKIDDVTRVVKDVSESKTTIVQFDHNSERITFELPRHIDGHDMSTCNIVQVHYLNVDGKNKEIKNEGVYEVDDLQISPDSDDVVIFSWLISGNATQLVGTLNFVCRFVCTSDDTTVDYAWNTATYAGIPISAGLYFGEAVVQEYADVLAQWEAKINAMYAESLAAVEVAAVNAANKAVTNAFTEAATVTDSADAPRGLKLLGRAEGSPSGNLFDVEMEFGYLSWRTGEPIEYGSLIRSKNFISVSGGTTILVVNDRDYTNAIYEYDGNRNFIKNDMLGCGFDGIPYQLQNETKYIRISCDEMDDPVRDLSVQYMVLDATANLFDGELLPGYLSYTDGGFIGTDDGFDYSSDFISVKGGSTIFVYSEPYSLSVFEYDESKSYIKASHGVRGLIALQNETRYIRINYGDMVVVERMENIFVFDDSAAETSYAETSYTVDIMEYVKSILKSKAEIWTFTLADGSTVEKEVVVG